MSFLKLANIDEINECQIEFDYYIPFSVQIGNAQNKLLKEKIVYWRTGDIERSLIEIGIGLRTGRLINLTLTAVKNALLSDIIIKNNKSVDGTPVFDLSVIPEKGICDYTNDFQVYLGKNKLTTIFGKKDKCEMLVSIGRVSIGFDHDNNINHVNVNDLTTEEYTELKYSLKL